MTRPPLNSILIVEDDPDIQAVARMALEALGGFSVEACDSGTTAVETAVAFRPDIILLDVMMPGMDGPSTLRALRANPQTAAIPIAFVTAKVQKAEVAKLKELGAVEVIEKPFDPMTLPDRVKAVWEKCDG